MFLPSRQVRLFVHLLPYPVNLAVALVVLVVPAWIWWRSTRDDPVGRGEPYGRVIPYPEWKEPALLDSRAELGGGGMEPNA